MTRCRRVLLNRLLSLLDEEEKYRRIGRSRDREYWLAALSARPDAVTLSGKSPATSRTFVRHSGWLSAELTASLASMGKMFRASLAQVIETAAALYLHRLTGADDVIAGIAPDRSRRTQDAQYSRHGFKHFAIAHYFFPQRDLCRS